MKNLILSQPKFLHQKLHQEEDLRLIYLKGKYVVLIEFSSELYPEKLKEISKPPSRLYVEGNVEILKENRNCSCRLKNKYTIWQRNVRNVHPKASRI